MAAPQSLEEWTSLISKSIDEHFEAIKSINYKVRNPSPPPLSPLFRQHDDGFKPIRSRPG